MTSFPWLTVTAALPIAGAVALAVLPRGRRLAPRLALAVSVLALAVGLTAALTQFDAGPDYQLTEQHVWIESLGANYALGVDGIGLTLVLLTLVLTPIVVLASWHDGDEGRWSTNAFFAWMLALEGLAVGVFAATDVFLFYVLFEATLIPIYFLIGGFGGARRSYAAVKFLLFSLLGGLLMLASVVGLYVVANDNGGPTYLLSELAELPMDETTGRWLFLGFFIAFAVKAPMFPVHTWLPDAAEAATPGTSVLLVSILDKIGTFGMIRFCLGLFPEASEWASPVVIVLAVVSVLYGAVLAIGQDDMRRLIAYTSLSHFGFIVLGIFVFTSQGASGSTLYMFNHGLSTAALFLVTGMLIRRHGSARISDYGGVQKAAPVLAGFFLVAGLSSLSLPGLSPFVSEFLVLAGTFRHSEPAAVAAVLGIVLAALYILLMYKRTMNGPVRPSVSATPDLGLRERLALTPAIALIVALGLYPQVLLDVIDPAVGATLEHVGVSDPAPDVPVSEEPPVTALAAEFEAPKVEYATIMPLLVVLGAAVLGVLVEAFAPRAWRYVLQVGIAVTGLLVALGETVLLATQLEALDGDLLARALPGEQSGDPTLSLAVEGAMVVDGPTVFLWGVLLVLSLICVLLFAERRLEGGLTGFAGQAAALPGTEAEREASTRGIEHTEVFPLMLFAVSGMLLFPASNDLLIMFVALEVLSLPLYLLCGLARRRRLLSQEAAMKYFLLGAFSSAFFLYGIALVYGYAGSFDLAAIDKAVSDTSSANAYLLGGVGLIAVGMLFKVGAAPFHAWTPDVYQGAPTSVTAFMAACTKIAAFGALLRIFYVAFGGASWDWRPLMWVVAILTMVVGSVIAITQTDVKRMLAYSSIAHAGFVLVGFVGVYAGTGDGSGVTSLSSVLFYLTAYGFSTIGAFAVVTLVRDAGGETTALSRWAGLGREAPVLAGTFAFFLLAFAGIPLTSGFIGKWTVFAAAWAGGAWPLVVVAVVMSAVAAFFYVRVIVAMFFSDPVGTAPAVAVPSVLTTGVIALTALATVALGVVPGPVLELAQQAGAFVR